MDNERPAPTRDDFFGPLPGAEADRRAPLHAALRRALARAMAGLAAPAAADPAEATRLIAALRQEIDVAGARQRERVALHPMLEAWLPRDVDAAVSVTELGLLVESLAAAPAAERPAWARRLFRRCGHLALEELVVLAATEDALRPVLATLATTEAFEALSARMTAVVPPARVQARLALILAAMSEAQRSDLLAVLHDDGDDRGTAGGRRFGLAA